MLAYLEAYKNNGRTNAAIRDNDTCTSTMEGSHKFREHGSKLDGKNKRKTYRQLLETIGIDLEGKLISTISKRAAESIEYDRKITRS